MDLPRGERLRPEDTALQTLLERLLAGAPPRADHDQPSHAMPRAPDPWLVQTPESFVVLALGVELLSGVATRGGTGVKMSALGALRDALRQRFDDTQWAHVEEEALRVWLWLDEHLGERGQGQEAGEAEGRRAQLETWRGIVVGALDKERDLLLSRLDGEKNVYVRTRLRPERIGAEEDGSWTLVGWRVPDGHRHHIPCDELYWLCEVERFQALVPLRSADIISFPGRFEE